MRTRFDEQLELLHRELIEMGALCEEAIARVSRALTEGNAALCASVPAIDTRIDEKERTIETLCGGHLGDHRFPARTVRFG